MSIKIGPCLYNKDVPVVTDRQLPKYPISKHTGASSTHLGLPPQTHGQALQGRLCQSTWQTHHFRGLRTLSVLLKTRKEMWYNFSGMFKTIV